MYSAQTQMGPYPQPGPPPQQNVVIVNDAGYQCYHNYPTKWAKIFGIGQIVCGCVIMATYITFFAVVAGLGFSVQASGYLGFWAPILFAIAGGFGVQSAKTKSRCTVTTTMVLSIIGAIPSGALSIIYIVSLSLLSASASNLTSLGHFLVACTVIIMIMSILEFTCAIGASVLCCKGCSGSSGPPSGNGMILHHNTNPNYQGAMPAQTHGMEMGAAPYDHKPPSYAN